MNISRHHRWLHPKKLPYIWMALLCLLVAPMVVLGVGALFAAYRIARWFRKDEGHPSG